MGRAERSSTDYSRGQRENVSFNENSSGVRSNATLSHRLHSRALISSSKEAATDSGHHVPRSPSSTLNSCTPARTDIPGVSGTGLEGSSTHESRRQVPLVELLSRMCQRSPTYSKRQWILETLASMGSVIWMVAASPRPRVDFRSQRVRRSPVRGPEMNSSSRGGTGKDVGDPSGQALSCSSCFSLLPLGLPGERPAWHMPLVCEIRLDSVNHGDCLKPVSNERILSSELTMSSSSDLFAGNSSSSASSKGLSASPPRDGDREKNVDPPMERLMPCCFCTWKECNL
mmetsp:Transcript_77927/g.223292  ORF Transcript_77927/g.223292 Transcript_77927/m.223292 type:complete len:286 (+) Transcript_77927:80-937(+)